MEDEPADVTGVFVARVGGGVLRVLVNMGAIVGTVVMTLDVVSVFWATGRWDDVCGGLQTFQKQ